MYLTLTIERVYVAATPIIAKNKIEPGGENYSITDGNPVFPKKKLFKTTVVVRFFSSP